MNNISLTVTEENKNRRLDSYLAENIDSSRSLIAKIIDDGNVFVVNENEFSKKIKIKASLKIQPGMIISINLPDAQEIEALPEDIPLDILYEDSDVIVVNKPKGMVVHPDNTHKSGTLVNALLFHCKDLSGIGGQLRPGIVHRIDMNTTGSVIACKNDISHNSISEQLKEHSITRRYLAIVCGVINKDEGSVDAPIGRSTKDRKKMAINKENGKRAVTHYKVLKRFTNHTLIECRLETGRTHQIRVHMASLNHPILGDDVYGKASTKFNLCGQCLHAYILGFIHPKTGEYIETKAPIPEYFNHLLEIL